MDTLAHTAQCVEHDQPYVQGAASRKPAAALREYGADVNRVREHGRVSLVLALASRVLSAVRGRICTREASASATSRPCEGRVPAARLVMPRVQQVPAYGWMMCELRAGPQTSAKSSARRTKVMSTASRLHRRGMPLCKCPRRGVSRESVGDDGRRGERGASKRMFSGCPYMGLPNPNAAVVAYLGDRQSNDNKQGKGLG